MSKVKEPLKTFVTRMFTLALVTFFLISFCTPLTYLCLARKGKQAEAAALAHQIACETQAILISNSDAQQQNITPLNNLVTLYQQRPDIKQIKIATSHSTIESSSLALPPSFFDIIQRVDITFRGITLGYVEVTLTTATILISTVLLTGIFFGLGLLINTLLYRWPVGIVSENEKDLQIMADKLKAATDELAYIKNLLEQTALIDCKTGLYNASQSVKRLEDEISKISHYGGSLAILMLDIDHFRQYNNQIGHVQGDEALITVARLLKGHIRGNDVAGRYGGEEFIIILPDIEQNQALTTADRLRTSIERYPFPDEEQLPDGLLTVSIGVSIYVGGSLTAQQFIMQAEQALQQAKSAGRNRTVIFQAT